MTLEFANLSVCIEIDTLILILISIQYDFIKIKTWIFYNLVLHAILSTRILILV